MRGQDTVRRRKRRFGALCAALALALSALSLPAWATDYSYNEDPDHPTLHDGDTVENGDTVSILLSGDIEATVEYKTYQNGAETTLGTWNADHNGGIETYVHAIGSEQQQSGSWAPGAPDFTDRSKWKVTAAGGGGESNYTLTLMEAFTVTFDGGEIGAGYVPQPIWAGAGDPIEEPTVEVMPGGYERVTWYKDQARQTPWTFHVDDEVEGDHVTGNTTLYAKWQGRSYRVTLDANGGTELGNFGITEVTFGEPMPELRPQQIPEYADHVFTGYFDAQTGGVKYYNKDGTSAKNWDKVVSEVTPATLYAQWAQSSYSVTLHPNDGTIGEGENLTSYPYGVATALPTVTKAGYTFDGWFDNEGLTGTAITAIDASAQGNKEYWAKWTPETYTIGYDLAGGSVSAENPTSYTVESAAITLTNPTREGYGFAGWTGTDLTEATMSVTIPARSTGNRSYTATWTQNAPAGVTWSLADGVLTITGSGAMEDYSRGGAPWFARRAEITSVVIDAGVTRVGSYAFYACGAVRSVTLGASVTELGQRAFAYCTGLSSVTCGALANVGEGAFYACFRLADQGFANGATIGNKAFELCGLGG